MHAQIRTSCSHSNPDWDTVVYIAGSHAEAERLLRQPPLRFGDFGKGDEEDEVYPLSSIPTRETSPSTHLGGDEFLPPLNLPMTGRQGPLGAQVKNDAWPPPPRMSLPPRRPVLPVTLVPPPPIERSIHQRPMNPVSTTAQELIPTPARLISGSATCGACLTPINGVYFESDSEPNYVLVSNLPLYLLLTLPAATDQLVFFSASCAVTVADDFKINSRI